ncbi:cysteine proteinase [Ophiobolus disseminans]|uniref:Ubiquitin carboxyl-terminal hydrolase n=1 Tax=Ophiobolus disseminans TaxID=1469910 RepID=A0A6A7A441_9PLEO|nr:cysteine proteinase [Ophiobolus disseminans]
MSQSPHVAETSPKFTDANGNQTMPSAASASSSNSASQATAAEQSSSTKASAGQTFTADEPLTPESPNSKKRALSELSITEEPISKKTKDSPNMSSTEDVKSTDPVFPSPPDYPATKHDKETWQGFCEIESEPAYFSVILREMGAQDLTVREVFGMTPDLLDMLPQPIYGLILLFRYREFGTEDQPTECPTDVWFANQLPAQNSCGTLAMINILMNSTEISIGEHLQQFKDFTSDMTPFQRGEAFASFDYVKKIHNSFAKKMDILEGDKHLSYKVRRSQRLKDLESAPKGKNITSKSRSRRHSGDSTATDDSAESFEENGHHFIAFVPVGNEVYKLDGLDKQPTSVGSFDPEAGETWLDGASDTIATLMAAGDDDDYGVVALTQSPLAPLRRKACLAINTLARVESCLDGGSGTWRELVSDAQEPTSPRLLGVEALLPAHPVPSSLAATIDSEAMDGLLSRRRGLLAVLGELAAGIVEEMALVAAEDEKASQRRFDGGPVVKKWLEMLAANEYLEENLKRFT